MVRNNFDGYRPLRDMTRTENKVPGRNFCVRLAGKTNGADQAFVEYIRGVGQTQVSSHAECNYLLVFCPIASRVGTDISEALENTPGGKPIILVVMHHTFNPNHVVAPSSRQVTDPNVLLTVDCLFYEGNLLKCDFNDIAWYEVQKILGVPPSQISKRSSWEPRNWFSKYWKMVLAGSLFVGLIFIVAMALGFGLKKN